MKIPGSGLRIDNPAFPLLQTAISYWGISDAPGSALGTTLICGDLANQPSFDGLALKILSGPSAGQVKPIATHIAGTNTLRVADAFRDNAAAIVQIVANTRFVILSASGGGAAPPPLSPSIGLWMFGECAPGMAASVNTLVMPNLAGFPDEIFNGEFWIQIIHNVSAPGVVPEREIRHIDAVGGYVGATGTFTTDDFSANVEAGDLVCVFHESIMGMEILAHGTLDADSMTIPADGGRAALHPWEDDNQFKGCLLMPTEGPCRMQPRRILQYQDAGGTFNLDLKNPFNQLPGLVDYVILADSCEFLPVPDSAANITPADVIGNKGSTPIFVPDNASDIIRYLKGILATSGVMAEPSESLIETWQDLLIDPNIWTVTDPGVGVAWAPVVSGAFLYNITTPNANEVARLVGDHLWQIHSITPNLNLIVKKTIIEFSMIIGVPGNVDNGEFFVGFTPNQADTRASDNIIGFALTADALQTLTDAAGGETVNTGFGETLTNHNKYRIEIYEETVDFYLNEVRIAQHTTTIPNIPSYPNFYIDTDAGGPCAFTIGIVKIWYEMVERY